MAKIGGVNFSGYATDPNWPAAVSSAYESTPQFASGVDIDTHISKIAPESPLVGKGEYMMAKAAEGGYDPRIAVAVAQHESNFGTKGRAARTMNPWNIGNDDTGRENHMASPEAAIDAFHKYATGRPQSLAEAKKLVRDPVDYEKRLRELGGGDGSNDGTYMQRRKKAEEEELNELINWGKGAKATKDIETPREKRGETTPEPEPEPKLETQKEGEVTGSEGPAYGTVHGTGESLEPDAWGRAAKTIAHQLLYGPVVKDIERGLVKSPIELGGGAYEGLRQAIVATFELNNWIDNLAYKMGVPEKVLEVANWPFNGDYTYWDKVIPKTPESDSVTGGLIKGIGQFLPAFLLTQGTVMGALGIKSIAEIGRVGRLGLEAIGVISSAMVSFDPNMHNLLDVTKGTILEEPLKAFYKNPESSRLEKRVYNAMEMLGIGAAFHGLVSGIKFMKGVEKAVPELEKAIPAVDEALAKGLESPQKPGVVPTELGPEATRFGEELASSFPKKGPKADEQVAGAMALYRARANAWALEEPGRVADDFFKGVIVAEGDKIPPELTGLQKGDKKPRGMYYSMEDGTKVIGLFKKANFSTLVHEGWHFFSETIPAELRSSLGEWRGKPLEKWEIGDHEHVARAFERWFAEGKGGRLSLPEKVQEIFAKFQKWMLDIYKSIKGSQIDVELSPELESVFQRTLGQSGEMQYGSKPFKQANPWNRQPGWINREGMFEPAVGGHGEVETSLKEGKVRVAKSGGFEVHEITPGVLENIEANLNPGQKIFSIEEASTGTSYMLHVDDIAKAGSLEKALKTASKEKYRPLYQEDNADVLKKAKEAGWVIEPPSPGKWYSRMASSFESGLPKRAAPEKYMELIQSLQKVGKFKEDEVQSSKVMEWLQQQAAEGKATILRSDLVEAIQMPGVKTEVLNLDESGVGRAYESSIPGVSSNPEGPNSNVVNLLFRSNKPLGYSGTGEAHWNMRDVLGHSRAIKNFPMKSGKPAMLVEEIQSDLHQQGRKTGYVGEGLKTEVDVEVVKKAIVEGPGSDSWEFMLDKYDSSPVFYDSNDTMWDTWAEAIKSGDDKVIVSFLGKGGEPHDLTISINSNTPLSEVAEMVMGGIRETMLDSQPPQAPFKDWVPFTVKQTLAWAAENGQNRVAFVGKEFQSKLGYATGESADITYGQELPRFLRSYAKQIGAKIETDSFEAASSARMRRPEQGDAPKVEYPVTVVDITESNIRTKGQPLFQEGEPPIPGIERITGKDKPLIEEVDRGVAEVLLDDSNYPTEVVRRGKAYNFNLSYVTDEVSLRELFNKVAETFRGEISDQARGKITDEALVDLADSMAMRPENVALWERGKAASAEEIHAARTIMSYSARKLSKVGEKAAGPNATDLDVAEFTKLLGVHLAIQKSVSGMAAEAGRALRAWQIDLGPLANSTDQAAVSRHLRSLVDSMGGSDHMKEIASMLQQMDTITKTNTFVKQATKATTSDMLLEAWINGLLSSPLTHSANAISNSSAIPLSYLENFAASGIGRLVGSAGGKPGIHEMEVVARAYGALQGMKDAFRLASSSFWNETSPFGPTRGKLETKFRSITSENLELSGVFGQAVDFLGSVIRLPGRALIASDTFFRAIAYRTELHGLGWRQAMHENLSGQQAKLRMMEIVENPKDFEAISVAAIDAGDYYTFNKQLGPTGQRLVGFVSSHPLLRLLVPFIRTPINIMKFTGERTPLALASQAVRAEIMSGDPARRDLALAKIGIGSVIMAIAGDYATSGSITGGGPKDPNERASLRRTGWQPYSFKVGDTYYSYNRTEPIGSLLGLAADAADIWGMVDGGDADKMAWAATSAIARNVTSKTFLKGISNFMEFMSEPDRFGGSYLKKMVAGLVVPSGVAQVERVTDPVMSDAQSILDEIKSRIPGLSDSVPPLRNIWGEPVKLGGGWGPDMISPIYTSKEEKSPIDMEIVNNKVNVQPLPRTVMGGQWGREVSLTGDPGQYEKERGVRLTADEYDRLQVIFGKEVLIQGQNVKEYLNTVVHSAEYQRASGGPEGGRAMLIKTVISAAKQEALRMLLKERPELDELVKKRAEDKARRLIGQ